jgi:hypothetical protein
MTPVELWTEALESELYTQGSYRLNIHNEEFCCLAVACEVYIKQGGNLRKIFADFGSSVLVAYLDDVTPALHTHALPESVQEWLGLTTKYGMYSYKGEELSLSGLNDTGLSFKEIAEIIKSRPHGLFVEGE